MMASNVLIAHPSTTTIAIVGAGFSGSLVAAHLLKTANRPLLIELIERSHDIGKGVAYSTHTISHLLNVSAGKMSAFPDDPGHLLRWLHYNRSELAAFLPSDLNSTEQDCGDPRPAIPQSTPLFRQFFDPESSTYTYLIADSQTKDAVLVDTVLQQVERDLQVLDDLGLTLRYCLETHIHADHITGAGKLRQQTGCQVMVPQHATARSADHSLADRETLIVGAVRIEAIATPGHTDSHLAYLVNNTHLLTGDALLIRGCGRTDFQSGDAGILYDAVTQRLFTLPEDTLVYPAHDYKGRTVSTIGEEKRFNPRFVGRSRDQFIAIMSHLGLSYPKKMNEAVPANEYCGDFIPEVSLSNGTSPAIDADREKVEQMLSTNTEIYESYFAMYI